MLRELKLPVLLGSLIVGGSVGLLTAQSLSRHSAEFSFAVDPLAYRSADAVFGSVSELRRYATAKGALDTVEFRRLESQLQNSGQAVRVDLAPRVKKRDLRDVPENLLSGEKGKSVLFDAIARDGRIFEAAVSANAPTADAARKMALFGMDYLRHSLNLAALRERLYDWGPNGRVALANIAEQIASKEAELRNIDERLAAVTALRARYKDGAEGAPAAASNVQVQVQTAKNLSPTQQAIGLEVDRIEAESLVKDNKFQKKFRELLIQVSDEFLPKLEAGALPVDVAAEMRKRIAAISVGDDPLAKLAHEKARTTVELALTEIEARWVLAKTQPEQPQVHTSGLRRSLAALLGAALGGLAWLGILFRRRMATAINKVLAENV